MDSARIEDLKRRIRRDPASIAFAQLGEEYRRAGRFREAVDTCRAGLRQHPGYLSARVTLGRALAELGHLDQAERELQEVLRLAPENLAALRALAEMARRHQDPVSALSYVRRARALAPGDTDLQEAMASLEAQVEAVDPSLTGPSVATSSFPPSPQAETRTPVDDAPATARTRRVIAALERWHDAIVADRQRRG